MHLAVNKHEAMCYEALCNLTNDREEAWRLIKSLKIDGSSPLPTYSQALFLSIGASEEAINSSWISVRDCFDKERISFEVLKDGDGLFPINRGKESVHYLYAAGNVELLKEQRITFLGMSHPSIQGKSDILSAVSEAVSNGYAIMAPLDTGLGAFALSVALKENGKAIAFLSGGLSKCPSEGLLALQGEIYSKGLLLSIFAPSMKVERYHVVYRNRYLAGIAEAVYLAEEKDGGPSWAIFDPAMESGIPVMLSKSIVDNPNFTWANDRASKGAMIAKKGSDIKKMMIGNKKPKKDKFFDSTPDLFADL